MLYTAAANDTFAQVASVYTIGGKAYGPAIANLADESGETTMTPGKVYEIPEGWLLDVWMGVGQEDGRTVIPVIGGAAPQRQTTIMGMNQSTLLLVGLGLLALVMWTGKK